MNLMEYCEILSGRLVPAYKEASGLIRCDRGITQKGGSLNEF